MVPYFTEKMAASWNLEELSGMTPYEFVRAIKANGYKPGSSFGFNEMKVIECAIKANNVALFVYLMSRVENYADISRYLEIAIAARFMEGLQHVFQLVDILGNYSLRMMPRFFSTIVGSAISTDSIQIMGLILDFVRESYDGKYYKQLIEISNCELCPLARVKSVAMAEFLCNNGISPANLNSKKTDIDEFFTSISDEVLDYYVNTLGIPFIRIVAFSAAKYLNLKWLEEFFRRDPELAGVVGHHGNSLFMAAIHQINLDCQDKLIPVLQLLYAQGVDVFHTDNYDGNVLHDICEDSISDVNVSPILETFHAMVGYGGMKRLSKQRNKQGFTPLMQSYLYPELLMAFLRLAGCDSVNILDEDGRSMLDHLLLDENGEDSIKILLAVGAEIGDRTMTIPKEAYPTEDEVAQIRYQITFSKSLVEQLLF